MREEPFEWRDYTVLAVELGNRADEASLRTAISRAYYFVYHLALERARRNGFTSAREGSTHQELWQLFKGSPEPNCMHLAQIGMRLKAKRQRADYELTFARIADEVEPVLAAAEDFESILRLVPERLPNPASVRQ